MTTTRRSLLATAAIAACLGGIIAADEPAVPAVTLETVGSGTSGEFVVFEERTFKVNEPTLLDPESYTARSFFGPRAMRRLGDDPETGKRMFMFSGDPAARFVRVRVISQGSGDEPARANVALNQQVVLSESDPRWDAGDGLIETGYVTLQESNELQIAITSAPDTQVTVEILGREVRSLLGPEVVEGDSAPLMTTFSASAPRSPFIRVTTESTEDHTARANIRLNDTVVVVETDPRWDDPEGLAFEVAVALEATNSLVVETVSESDTAVAVEVLATEPERRSFTGPPEAARVFLHLRSESARAHIAVNDDIIFEDENLGGGTVRVLDITDIVNPDVANTLEIVLTSPERSGLRAEIVGSGVPGARTAEFSVVLPTGATASCEAATNAVVEGPRHCSPSALESGEGNCAGGGGMSGEFLMTVTPLDVPARARISIDGNVVVDPTDFDGSGNPFEVPVTLSDPTTLDVTVLAGQQVRVAIDGIDVDPPSIVACVSPDPLIDTSCAQQEGTNIPWHNSDVTISFVCDDATSAIQNCEDTAVVQTEGRLLAVTGMGTDLAGNEESAATVVCVDKTAPRISDVAPGEASPVFSRTFELSGRVTDGLSGLAGVECSKGDTLYPTTIEDSDGGFNFHCDAELARGELNVFRITATDQAGNQTFFSRTITASIPRLSGENCTASILNHVSPVIPKDDRCSSANCMGTFYVPNVPADDAPYRVRVACLQADNDETTGASNFLMLVPGGTTAVEFVELPPDVEIPEALSVTGLPPQFGVAGQQGQLMVDGLVSDGSMVDLTEGPETTYASSNARIATVDDNGIVTAHSSGTALISARHQGRLATAAATVKLADDADGDGLPDDYEKANGLDPNDPADALEDVDGDGLTTLAEFNAGTSPFAADTDGDGLDDAEELVMGTPATVADIDQDGLVDGDELANRSNPFRADTDGDGISDGDEVRVGLDPTRGDSNGDGIADGDLDSDGDGLSNLDEVARHTDPTNPDTDGDGIPDGRELELGEDPLVKETVRPVVALVFDTEGVAKGGGPELLGGQTVVIRADATDNVAVDSVAFTINDFIFTDRVPPYETVFTVPLDYHELQVGAVVVDVNDNQGSAPAMKLAVTKDPLTSVEGQVVDMDERPVADAAVEVKLAGLLAEYFFANGPLADFPGFEGTEPDVVQRISAINFVNPDGFFTSDTFGIGREEQFAARISAQINIVAPGRYFFTLGADDGGRLYIDDRLVTEVEPIGHYAEAVGTIGLKRGDHSLRIEYFQDRGNSELKLAMRYRGGESQVVRSLVLLQAGEPVTTVSASDGRFSLGELPAALGNVRTVARGQVPGNASKGVSPDTSSVPDEATDVGMFAARAVPPGFLIDVAAGDRHACAVGYDGSVHCWGRGREGQVGKQGGMVNATPLEIKGVPGLVSITAGGNHTCGLTLHGKAYCWGQQGHTGPSRSARSPGPVSHGLFFTALSAGGDHTCGLDAHRKAHCWGGNADGQLGDGTHETTGTPVEVAGDLLFAKLSAGAHHTCGLSLEGNAYCWGRGLEGQLGQGADSSAATPVAVGAGGSYAFADIQAGALHTCGTTVNGLTYCWGLGDDGRLGVEAPGSVNLPQLVDADFALQGLANGEAHNCGLSTVGAPYCWGRNEDGQLGQMPSASIATPEPMRAGPIFTRMRTGGDFSCGLTVDRALYCWGGNASGQLGYGTTEPSYAPLRVETPELRQGRREILAELEATEPPPQGGP